MAHMSNKKNRHPHVLFLLLSLSLLFPSISQAQVLKVLASDTFIGIFNGALLGAGTMALSNNGDAAPLRYGVGFGTLYGLSMGAVDVSSIKTGKSYTRESTLNTTGTSAQIILMDTFYGGAAGVVVGFAISLIANQPIAKGLQYGSASGVWAGFGFGVMDAFYLSKPTSTPTSSNMQSSGHSGLLTIGNAKTSVSFIQPVTILTTEPTSHGLERKLHAGLQVADLRISF